MTEKYFGREHFRTYRESIRKEWVITNGLGSYAGSSIIGANTRKHHGLFIASLHAPTERYVLVNRIKETIIRGDRETGLYSGDKKTGHADEGFVFQSSYRQDFVPEFTYVSDGLTVKKTVAFEWEKNTVAVLYEITNRGEAAVLSLVPVYNYRDHNNGSLKSGLKFTMDVKTPHIMTLTPLSNPELSIKTYLSEGSLKLNEGPDRYDTGIKLQTEIDTGMSANDTGFTPVSFLVGMPGDSVKTISVVFSIEDDFCKDAKRTVKAERERLKKLIKASGVKGDFLKDLVEASDKFVCRRASTGGKTILAGLPWFTDWGRDTMISLTGLTLVTKRFDDAESILKTFVKYEKNGLLPNMFPDEGCEPIYNTADASLWFFYCIYKYIEYAGEDRAYGFVKSELYPTMKKIISAYRNGTDFSIGMDTDGLVFAGSDLDQVTWMDVRVDKRVVTPRHGKPVEINALWYNALCITSEISDRLGDKKYSMELSTLARKVYKSFNARFFNDKQNCLKDVVDERSMETGEISDNLQVRSNQIWAVSLPFVLMEKERAKAVVDTVYRELYTDFGIRTLSPKDPEYHGLYKGALHDRDEAYHQGTAWAFIMGGFITAFLKVYPERKGEAGMLLRPLKGHLNDGCIGGIAEVFDADAPHISGGCYTQAWSVGEILRAVYEGKLEV